VSERPRRKKDAPPAIAATVLGAVQAVLAQLGARTEGDPDEMFDRAAIDLDEPLIGIAVARRVPVGAYGLLEYGLRASATVGDAVQRLARHYASVSTRVRTEVALVDGRSALVFHRAPSVRFSRHWIEMPAAAIANRIAEGAGHEPLLHEVRFAHREPPGDHRHRHAEAFGAPVSFRADIDALVFLDGALQRPMNTSAPPVASSVDATLAALEAAATPFLDPLQLRIRAAILRGLGSGVTLASVARELKLAPRTLQRAIAERGTSWSHELDEVRRARALELLDASDHKTASIAADLGFRDASAFFRAFRRWTGTTPRHRERVD
jgi:AraC-like DNA-binding protein